MDHRNQYRYTSVGERFKNEWRIYLIAFIFVVIADLIGQKRFPVGPGMLILFPIFYALIMGVGMGPHALKFFKDKEVKAASGLVLVAIGPFIAKLGITAGGNIMKVISAGPALFLQELGNLGTIFLALPVAILLGLKRESIGACHSINRETSLALVNDVYGPDSAETRGSLSIYVVGGMVGTIYFGFMATMCAAIGLWHPFALAMASGVGAGIMMASASASLAAIYPELADQIMAFAGTSETLSGIDGIYIGLFLALPITNWLYNKLEPTLGKFALGRSKSEVKYIEVSSEEAIK